MNMNIDQSNNENLKNWIAFNRDIASMLRNRVISRNEYFLYMHLRLNCNPYGICSTNINAIKSDIFSNVSINYINKLLLSLKGKELVWFERRQGSRSSFEVHFGDFILPDKKIRSLNKYFNNKSVRTEDISEDTVKSELDAEDIDISQMFKDEKKDLTRGFSMDSAINRVRSDNNDTDTYTDNDKIVNQVRESESPNKFFPKSFQEERCKGFAIQLGEKDMRYILSAYRKHGLNLIERAYTLTMESESVEHKGKYFNKLVNELGKEKQNG
jgi:hypothetical protein